LITQTTIQTAIRLYWRPNTEDNLLVCAFPDTVSAYPFRAPFALALLAVADRACIAPSRPARACRSTSAPPMQDPASYNLDQVMEQLKKMPSHPSQ
jgi:hypothetical protein